jgi:hypothetical protein
MANKEFARETKTFGQLDGGPLRWRNHPAPRRATAPK